MSRPVSAPNVAKLNAAKNAAATLRARTLARVAVGQITAAQVIAAAATHDGIPLRRITVRRLLESQPGWGVARVNRVIEHLRAALSCPPRMTVGWLLDPRASNARLAEFVSVTGSDRADTAWAGWPYLPGGIK